VAAQSIRSLDDLAARKFENLEIFVEGTEDFEALGQALGPANGSHAKVSVIVSDRALGGEIEIVLAGRYSILPEVEEALAQTPGVKGLRGT
jgi:hypothetical protein